MLPSRSPSPLPAPSLHPPTAAIVKMEARLQHLRRLTAKRWPAGAVPTGGVGGPSVAGSDQVDTGQGKIEGREGGGQEKRFVSKGVKMQPCFASKAQKQVRVCVC